MLLNNNPIEDSGIEFLVNALVLKYDNHFKNEIKRNCMPLGILGLSNCAISNKGLNEITKLIIMIKSLNKNIPINFVKGLNLYISGNAIKDNGLQLFADAILKFHGIESLDLSKNINLKGEGIQSIIEGLQEENSINSIDISGNDINSQTFHRILKLIEDNIRFPTIRLNLPLKIFEKFAHEEPIELYYEFNTESKKDAVPIIKGRIARKSIIYTEQYY